VVWYSEENQKVCRNLQPKCGFIHDLYPGVIKKARNAKVAVYTCGIDISQTETKGTVLLHNADEMLNFTTGEEKHMAAVSSPHFGAWCVGDWFNAVEL
jgi:chaperonin GroEL (HSP60 family)